MIIRRAQRTDLPDLLALYAHARAFMAKNGNPTQWGNDRPSRAQLEADIAAGALHVLEEEGRLLAAFVLMDGPDPTYAVIKGAWPGDAPYGVVHRVACMEHGRGLARRCIEYAKARYRCLRIDTHADNKPMQALIAKCGFVYCGVIYVENGDPRLAYQWEKLD